MKIIKKSKYFIQEPKLLELIALIYEEREYKKDGHITNLEKFRRKSGISKSCFYKHLITLEQVGIIERRIDKQRGIITPSKRSSWIRKYVEFCDAADEEIRKMFRGGE